MEAYSGWHFHRGICWEAYLDRRIQGGVFTEVYSGRRIIHGGILMETYNTGRHIHGGV